jgi:hypothetical protein
MALEISVVSARTKKRQHHQRELGRCLLVLNSVTSTQWIRQSKPCDDLHDVYVFVCKCVLGSSRASQPLNILVYAFSSTLAFSLRLMPLRLAVCAASTIPDSSAPALPSLITTQRDHPPHLTSSLTPPLSGVHYIHLT